MATGNPEMLDEYLEYLDGLKEFSTANMFGAASYLQGAYPELSKQDAQSILGHWMDTFSERHAE